MNKLQATLQRTAGAYATRARVLLLSIAVACAPTGCAASRKPIFPEPEQRLVWPLPPAPPRVEYVGSLRSDKDLKAPPKLFEGLTTLLAGKKPPQELFGPRSVVVTPDGQRVWVADPGGRCLHGFDLEKRVYRKVDQVGEAALLTPVHVSPGPAGSLYLCDSEAVAVHRLRDTDGTWIESLRLPEDLVRPAAVAFDGEQNDLFVADVSAHDVKVLARDGSLLRILGRRGTEPGEFNYPTNVELHDGFLWVVDTGNYRVQKLTRAGEPVWSIGGAGDAPGDLAMPKGLAFDVDGHLYVVDGRFENVQVFDMSGRLLLVFGQEGTQPGEFWLPAGMFIDTENRIWICDSYNRRLQVMRYLPANDTDE